MCEGKKEGINISWFDVWSYPQFKKNTVEAA
jgi:hypothetical protein